MDGMASTWNKTIGIIILIITPALGLISKPWSPWSARQTFSGMFTVFSLSYFRLFVILSMCLFVITFFTAVINSPFFPLSVIDRQSGCDGGGGGGHSEKDVFLRFFQFDGQLLWW